MSLGSVIFPVTADAAATNGEAKYVLDSTCPILPGKLRLVVLIQTSSLANTPMCAPQHAPQVGGPTTAPASMNILIRPLSSAFLLPIEIDENAYTSISDGDELEITTEKNEIKNLTKNQTYSMKPFSEIISKIIAAGGLFKYKP